MIGKLASPLADDLHDLGSDDPRDEMAGFVPILNLERIEVASIDRDDA